jgi:hypothetical protein
VSSRGPLQALKSGQASKGDVRIWPLRDTEVLQQLERFGPGNP